MVVAMELLEHFEDPLQIAKECARYGKFIIFSTPVYSTDEEAVDGKFHLRHILPTKHLELVSQIGKVKEFTIVPSSQKGTCWSMSLVETS